MKNLRVTFRLQNNVTEAVSFAEEDFDTPDEFYETIIETLSGYKEMRDKYNVDTQRDVE